MIGAEPARWWVLLLGLELACGRPGTEASASEGVRATAATAQVIAPSAFAASPSSRRWLEIAASTASSRADPTVSKMRPSEPVGGRWVSCYANYRPTSTPEREVARLGDLCGPENGMVPVGSIVVGDAVDAAEDHHLQVWAGDCFRIFAVADAFVADLGVEVTTPRGNAITWDRNGDRWPILNPEGPFCLFDAGTYTVRVRALSGKGRYAMQVWRLP